MAPRASTMQVKDVMTQSLICATADQDLLEVERLLVGRQVSGVPVVEEGRLVGVLSANDVARVQVLMNSLDGQVDDRLDWQQQADGFQHSDPPEFDGFRQMISRLKVRDAMREQVVVCRPEDTLSDVARKMLDEHLHRVIVVDGERPVGIVSSLDLVKVLADELATSGS
jgi:CBS domain-containing protein